MARKSKFKFAIDEGRGDNTAPAASGDVPEVLYVKFIKNFEGSFGMTKIVAKSGDYRSYTPNIVSYLKQFGVIECQ